MSTKAKRHTHKYHRIEIASSLVWACALPDCNHYMPEHMSELVPGKYSLCWGSSPDCLGKFVLNPANMKNDRPLCNACADAENAKLSAANLEKKPTDLTDDELEAYINSRM